MIWLLYEEKELQRGHQKSIYGVNLAANAKEYLLQMVKKPKYLFSFRAPKEKTQAIVAWWRDRLLKPRIKRPERLDAVRQHDLVYPIKHGARVQLPRTDIDQLKLF